MKGIGISKALPPSFSGGPEGRACAPALVIGIGNPLRRDDAAGWLTALRLADLVDPRRVTTIATHQLIPELAEPASRASRVIFIDAAVDGTPGTLSRASVIPEPQPQSLTHGFTPSALLALAVRLYDRVPPAELFTVAGADFRHGEDLSPSVERACNEIIHTILETLSVTRASRPC
jgi:hydrogenase maturation protease